MQRIESKLTVYFDEPFWVGVYERSLDGKLEVCKITFGAEPKDVEVYEYFLKNWQKLRFSLLITDDTKQEVKINPKRMRRAIKYQLESIGIGTKSQQALKLQQEAGKIARKDKSLLQKEEEKQYKYELKQQKRREKHRGR